jgi:hypothetical protein
MAAVDGVMGSAIGEGNGNGNGGGGGSGGGMTFYGAPDGGGLRGSFYDLKQTPGGNATDIAENDTEKQIGPDSCDSNFLNNANTQNQLKFLSKFIHSWDPSLLDGYYKASGNLFLSQICIPSGPSSKATIAYHVENKVVARRWIAIYHATIIPPESGTFRFIGGADDFMVVRIGDQNVLDASITSEMVDPKARTGDDVGGFVAGPWFHLEQGTPVKPIFPR